MPFSADATVYTLVNNNSSATLDLGTSAGLNSWVVDGQNQENQQWYWFRIGPSGPQMDLTAITTSPFVTINSASQLTALYTNGGNYGVQLQYTLAGQAPGSGNSGLTESVRVFNYNASSTLDLHLFLYSDFTLRDGGYTSDQYVQEGTLSGVSTSTQTLGNFGVGTNNFTAITPATLFEVEPYSQTRTSLTTVNGYNLNGTTSGGPGHITWAMQWDKTINPSSSFNLSLLDNMTNVPEPSVVALALVGLSIGFFKKNKKRA
ncbi:MAG: hypothetical protein C5B50_16640 [Verrucomicrobia bacterium]|nr:MAG: hypothetical protein C5B50_16640 [Verrucomicrobiota bacterium]